MAVINFTTRQVRELQPSGKRETFFDGKEKGLFVRVYPSGRKTYFLNYAHNGFVKIGDADILTAQAARIKARRERSKIEDGIDPKEARKQKKAGTFAGYFKEHYRAYILDNQKGSRQALSRYKNLCEHPDIGGIPLAKITVLAIEKYKLKRKQAGKAESTINREVAAITALVRHALDMGFISQLPFKGRVKKYREISENPRYLFPEEESSLRAALEARDSKKREGRDRGNAWRLERGYELFPEIGLYGDHLAPLVLTAMLTGCRKGELFNLTWQDVDLQDPQEASLTIKARGAKSGKTRTIPLSGECWEVLNAWKRITSYGESSDYVFPGESGKRLDNVSKSFKNLLDDAGIKNFRFHDLRHHFASSLVQRDIDLYKVKALLGHSDFKTTQRYAHLAPDNLREAVRVLDRQPTMAAGTVEDNKSVSHGE